MVYLGIVWISSSVVLLTFLVGFWCCGRFFLWVVQRTFVCLFGSAPVSVVVVEWAPCMGRAQGVLGPGAGCFKIGHGQA